jgi:poly-gamma-glutamate capsule biosynthesis protein CapA/YwtB (metallophosphatase superfamily)
MATGARRILRRIGIGLALTLLGAGLWALWWTLYNPKVPLADPTVLWRDASGPDVTVLLAGDFAPTDAAMPIVRERGWDYPYGATGDLFRSADVAFANLEAPVTDSNDRFPLWKMYFYKVEPAAVGAWQRLGLDVVSLANNHAIDYRERGITDTLWFLDDAGIAHVGAGGTETEARRPVIFDVGGTRIGFLAYLEHTAASSLYLRTFAQGDRVGCAQLNRLDVEQDVRRLRPLVDILIVSVHWGANYEDVTPTEEDYARRLANLGVDVVAGHHAHDVQAVETIGRTVVLYSLGNYAWGTPGWPQLRIGFLARLSIAPRRGNERARLSSVELLPIATQNSIVNFQPRPIREDERDWLGPFLRATASRGAKVEVVGTAIRVALP